MVRRWIAGVLRRRAADRTLLALPVVCALLLPTGSSRAAEVVNPHTSPNPKFCLNCHTEDIYAKTCNESEGYCLLAGSVDGLCLTCHIREDCCKPGLEHLPKLHLGKTSHMSDYEAAKIPDKYKPKSLPIQHGRITCGTCHLHTQDKSGYKMLRLVRMTEKGVDWSYLCHDCHKDN